MADIPTRIAIGTQKAASSYLYNLLKSHKGVSLSKHTEINFYSSQYERGVDWYTDSFTQEGIRVDISPKYFMQGAEVAPRIHATLGNTKPKLLLILRNPIDYLMSHFAMQQQQGFFEQNEHYPHPPSDLVPFVHTFPEYGERARYYDLLTQSWLTHFSLSDFKIVFFEDFVHEHTHSSVLRDILAFWDIPQAELSAPAISTNRALRFSFLHTLKDSVIARPQLKEFLKKQSWFAPVYKKVLTKTSHTSLTPEDRSTLADMYISDVRALEALLGRKVPWTDFQD